MMPRETWEEEASERLIGVIRQRRRKMINFIPEDVEQRVRGRIRVEPEDDTKSGKSRERTPRRFPVNI